MATSLHFHGVGSPNQSSSFLPLYSFTKNLNLGASQAFTTADNGVTRRMSLSVCCRLHAVNSAVAETEQRLDYSGGVEDSKKFSIVMKFGGSSLASAARMREVADLIMSFPEECPVVVLSAMGKTTNNLLNVWKDVDGVLTCVPTIYDRAHPVPYLTFEEAAELAYFGAQVLHPQSMRPAREGDIPVRVKNSYNPKAPGTLITRSRDMSEDLGISVDVVATSEVSISLTLDPSKLWSRELIKQMISQGASKVNISLIVNDDEADKCVKALHRAFFEGSDPSQLQWVASSPRTGNRSPN